MSLFHGTHLRPDWVVEVLPRYRPFEHSLPTYTKLKWVRNHDNALMVLRTILVMKELTLTESPIARARMRRKRGGPAKRATKSLRVFKHHQ